MKRILCFLLCFFLLISGTASACADFSLIVASDLHYISPELTDGGESYQRVLQAGDSKFMPYIEAITEAFFDEVMAARPDALLLTGDLSFNGALLSHEALTEKFRKVEAAGIPVLVTTGNHDVLNPFAASFEGEQYRLVSGALPDDFAALYAAFGPSEALCQDSDSLSYVYPLNAGTRLLVLDANTAHDPCGLSERTLAWVEDQLREARDAGAFVLAAGHQNLYQQTIFRSGYVLEGADSLASLLREYGVPLYLSGHLHVQHRLSVDGLTEIASSALCSYPCQYGLLTERGGALHYETRRLDLAAWAERNGQDDPVYRDFSEAAGTYMDEHFGVNPPPELAASGDWPVLSDYLRLLNRAYFSGDLRGIDALDPDGSLAARWLSQNDLTAAYVRSVLQDAGLDFCVWDSNVM